MSIEKRYNKNGKITSFRIEVYHGHNADGTPRRHRMTWRPAPGMTDRQIEKEVNRIAVEFENSIIKGLVADKSITFAQYADKVIAAKECKGLSYRTVDRYRELSVRTNLAMGHLKLNEITSLTLNEFYKNLSESNIRLEEEKATSKPLLAETVSEQKLSLTEIHRRCGVSVTTVSCAVKGKTVLKSNADNIILTESIFKKINKKSQFN